MRVVPQEPNYIDQYPDALRLTLVEGTLDPAQFSVFSKQDLMTPKYRLTAHVIGASHLITYRYGELEFSEVFACTDIPGVASWSLDDLTATSVVREFEGLRYEFTAWNEPWSDPEPLALRELVAAADAHGKCVLGVGIEQQFPQGEEFSVTPKTVVVGSVDHFTGKVIIETAHSYPNCRGLVMSRSVLTHTTNT